MSEVVIKIENIGKQYRLGQVGTGTLSHDLNRAWFRLRGKEDPYLKIGEENDRSAKGGKGLVWALKDINFEVKRGEVLGIIGKNGAGKSTLLKILSQITSPTIGEIKVKGRIAALLEVGTGFHPDLTGRENIYLNGAILGMTKLEIKNKFDEIVDFSGVAKYIDTPVKRYSSGMMVRLGFAVAAHLEPEILIVDEVLAVGDSEFQKKCLGKMKDVSGEGRTILFVSHNMAAMQNLCNNCVWLSNGRLKESGETNYIINKYLNNVSQSAFMDLNDRQDRQGNGSIRITEVVFKNNANERVTDFFSGQDVSIFLKYETAKPIDGSILIALGFNDQNGVRIFNANNEHAGFQFNSFQERGSVVCKITNLPLTQGSYPVTLFLSVNGEVADWIQDAFILNVEDGDFFGTGKAMYKGQGNFLVKNEWFIEQ